MDSAELLSLYREEMGDQEDPFLVSNKAVYGYIDDAQKQFCRRTEGIEDAISFGIVTTPGLEWYPTSPRILKFRRAVDVATDREIPTMNPEKLGTTGWRGPYGYGHHAYRSNGPVSWIEIGAQKNMVRLRPVPRFVQEVRFEVFRLPATLEPGDELEIDEQHHRHLLLWVKSLAYGIQDVDLFDRRKSDDYEQRFIAYCATARKEQERARRVVGTVAYGGI